MANSAAEAAKLPEFLGASALLSPQCSSFTEHSAAEILAGLRIGQHILDFGGILMSFLSDLPFGPGSRVISSQQLLCVLAPSQMNFPGEFISQHSWSAN